MSRRQNEENDKKDRVKSKDQKTDPLIKLTFQKRCGKSQADEKIGYIGTAAKDFVDPDKELAYRINKRGRMLFIRKNIGYSPYKIRYRNIAKKEDKKQYGRYTYANEGVE